VSAARRLRLLRLRAIEHRIATAAAARAGAALGNIITIEARVGRLRQGLTAAEGETTGCRLQSLSELADRLDRAQNDLSASRLDADAERHARDVERQIAHRAEEIAHRLHATARDSEASARERRADASRIWRKRAGSQPC
jgi:hypothetical protein